MRAKPKARSSGSSKCSRSSVLRALVLVDDGVRWKRAGRPSISCSFSTSLNLGPSTKARFRCSPLNPAANRRNETNSGKSRMCCILTRPTPDHLLWGHHGPAWGIDPEFGTWRVEAGV